jgi:hypothetical protein
MIGLLPAPAPLAACGDAAAGNAPAQRAERWDAGGPAAPPPAGQTCEHDSAASAPSPLAAAVPGLSLRAAVNAPLPPPPPPAPPPSQPMPLERRLTRDCLARCLSWVPDPAAAALACRALAGIVSSDPDFAFSWFSAGGAAAPGSASAVRVAAWRRLRGRGAGERTRWLIACRRRARQEGRGGGAAAAPAPVTAAAALQQKAEEAQAEALLAAGRPVAALLLLSGPRAEHLLLPLAARAGDMALVRELAGAPDQLPPRPLLLERDAAAVHFVLPTAARAALRAGAAEVADWLIERALEVAEEVSRMGPGSGGAPAAAQGAPGYAAAGVCLPRLLAGGSFL